MGNSYQYFSELPGRYSPGLACLRGIAALMVLVFHALLVLRIGGIDDAYRLPLELEQPWLVVQHILLGVFNGSAYVTLFFVLSGTVLALSLERSPLKGPLDLLGYFVKRGFRLYPLLIFAAIIGALLQAFYLDRVTYQAAATWINNDFKVAPEDLPYQLLTNAIGWSSTLNTPAWSIRVEIVASALFPLLYVLSRRLDVAAITAVVLVVLMFALPGDPYRYLYINLFALCFFIGALITKWAGLIAENFYRWPLLPRISVVVLVLVIMMFSRRLLAPSEFVNPAVIILETIAAAVLVTLVFYGGNRRVYHLPGMRRLGEISYGVYLLHVLVLNAIAHTIFPLLPDQLGSAAAFVLTLFLIIATAAITLPVARLVYILLERPMIELGRQLALTVEKAHWQREPSNGTRQAALSGAVVAEGLPLATPDIAQRAPHH